MGSSGSRSSHRSGRWGWLFPRFEESIPAEFYRAVGRFRVFVAGIMLAIDLGFGGLLTRTGLYDAGAFWSLQIIVVPVLIADIALGHWLWRSARPKQLLRRITLVCVVLEAVATLVSVYALGSVTAHHLIIVGMALSLVYRLLFDFAIGAVAAAVFIVGLWAVALCEIGGLLPHAPVPTTEPGALYGTISHQLTALATTTVVFVVTFLAANYAVARLSHSQAAVRLLREHLEAVDPDQVGRHSGRTLRDTYVLGPLLGRGGMGEVYRGRHLRTGRPVAVKLLHAHLADDDTLVKRFQREAEIIGRLGHNHIVDIIDIDHASDQPFMVLELLEGESLHERMNRAGPLDLDFVVRIITEVARGLEAAHRAGVTHRDLTPRNIFLVSGEGEPTAKILDFGISKIGGPAQTITQESQLLGTPNFMSPEQAVGGDIDSRTDVFALGALAYAAIAGERPFAGASLHATLRQVCDAAPAPLVKLRPDISPQIDEVLAIAMAKKASERYETATELSHDLAAAVRGEVEAAILERAKGVHRGVRWAPVRVAGNASATDETATDETAVTVTVERADG